MTRIAISVAAALVLSAGASAAVYPDPVGDIAVPNPNIDLALVTVTNSATDLSLSIQLNDNLATTDWGKYLVFIDTNGGASGRSDNPWGRAINTGGRLNDFFVGSWIDSGGGAQLWQDTGSWSNVGAPTVDLSQAASGIVTYTIPLASLGLSVGNTFFFDIATTGGGTNDPGIDHLSQAGQATPGWGTTVYAR
jgi:hypothetical protein